MGFRDEFWLTNQTYAEWSLENTTRDGFRANQERLTALQKQVKSTFEQGIDRLAQSQAVSSTALQGELAYQAERISEQISQSSSNVVAAVQLGSADIVASIQQMSDYLGSELCEVRWAVERQTKVSEEMIKVLLNSLSNESRQYFEQGVKCYETNECDFAKERFNKALELNRTNHFAYQYLGFVAAKESNSDEAIKNFDLARKFAETDYHEALALSHLARSYYALKDIKKAVDFAEGAAKAHSATAKFWYDLSTYHAFAKHKSHAISALQQAIEKDWTYWAVVATDKDFDSLRVEVIRLLDELREREREKSRQFLDNLKHAIDLAIKAGVEKEVSTVIRTAKELEQKYRTNNVFAYREIQFQALKLRDEAFNIAKQISPSKISDKKRQLNELQNQIDVLNSALPTVGSKYKKWWFPWFVYPISYPVYMFAAITIFAEVLHYLHGEGIIDWSDGHISAIRYALYTSFAPFIILFIINIVINKLRYKNQVIEPKRQIEQSLAAKTREVEPMKMTIEQELKSLEDALQMCRYEHLR